jgi:DNA-binding CsgD family transcriptional regulator/tetratricopeptide (TPR) repeat protein
VAPVLERDDEQRRLAALASADGPRVLLVEGPAGIGKTTLLERAVEAARAGGMTVLRARGSELEQDYPYGVVHQLLDAPVAGLGADGLAGPGEHAAWLFGRGAPPVALPGQDQEFAILNALYWTISAVAGDARLLLVVDDLQWADTGSLRFLAFLARRAEGSPVTIAGAMRAEPTAATGILEELQRDADVLRPAPLSPAGVAGLVAEQLGAEPDPEFAAACHGATGGNPFLAMELCATLRADAWAPRAENAARIRGLGPAGIARAVLGRLGAAGPGALGLARACAVLGDGADAMTAGALAGVDGPAASEAADVLAALGVLRDERPLAFVHAIVRQAILEDCGAGERSRLHRRAADLLAAGAGEPEAVAAHLLATEPAGDAWVAERLHEQGVRAQAAGDNGSAVDLLRRALAEPPAAGQRPAVLLALGTAEARTPGAASRSIDRLTQARALTPPGVERLGVSLELSRALIFTSRAHDAYEVLAQFLLELPEELAELGLIVQAAIMHSSFGAPEIRRAVATTPWRFAGDDDGAAATAGQRAWLATRAVEECIDGTAADVGRFARAAYDGGSLLAEQTADSPVFQLAGNALWWADATADAHRAWTAAIDDARRRGSARAYATASSALASIALRHGDVGEALALAAAALPVAAEDMIVLGAPIAAALAIEAHVERGELDEAERVLGAGHLGNPDADSVLVDVLVHSTGLLRLAQRRPAEALERFEACGRRQARWNITSPAMVPWRSAMVTALLALDRRDEAAAVADDDLAAARAWGADRPLGLALRAAGMAETGDDGIDLLRESAAVLERSETRLEHARTLVELGSALRRAGARADARTPLREGLAAARACGAYVLADRAHDELTATGATQRRMTRVGVETLTPSERRTAEMAATGMSNREIAAALFVTVRTVEAHLGHTFAKLGITGRADLARALDGKPPA